MNKSNNHAYGLLKSQYISVLKKCAVLNAMAALLMLPGTAKAEDTIETLLSTKMGTNVGGTVPSISGLNTVNVYIDADRLLHITTNLDASEKTATLAANLYGDSVGSDTAWILNQGTVNIGNSSVTGTFSHVHSQTGDIDAIVTGGGLITNGSRNYSGSGFIDSLLTVNNVQFSDVSASPNDNFSNTKNYGGVIESYSTNTGNSIINSAFRDNFVMGGAGAYGGAVMVYNGDRKVDGSADVPADSYISVLSSNNNTYERNHAGNLIYGSGSVSDVTDANLVGASYFNYQDNKYGQEAKGGAVYNGGNFTSAEDTFTDNYAIGQKAFGGAIYNTNANSEKGRTDQYLRLSVSSGSGSNFSGNTAYAVSNGHTGNVVAAGGAVYNNGYFNMTSSGSKTTSHSTYSNNSARTEDGNSNAKAYGGALANTRNYYGNTENFTGNMAYSDSGKAYGGAIFNGQVDDTETSKSYLELTGSTVNGNAVSGGSMASGGAIHNDTLGTMTASSLTLNNNQVSVNLFGTALGGALSNSGQINVSSSSFGGNTVEGNLAGGGALAHTASNSVTIGSSVVYIGNSSVSTSSLSNNTVTASYLGAGGAVAASGIGSTIMFTDTSFSGNTVNLDEASATTASVRALGGALYNGNAFGGSSATSYVSVRAEGSDIAIISNKVKASSSSSSVTSREYSGGAFYNDTQGSLTLYSANHQLLISGNDASAGQGGAIYNKGSLVLTTSGTGSIVFTANTASEGEAIYNAAGGAVTVNMSGTSSVTFNENQNVYNLGTINVTGNRTTSSSPSSTLVAAAAYLTQSVNPSLASVNLNSELDGTGTYNFTNSQLNMESKGKVNYNPVMTLTNNNINMAGGSVLNLDYNDTLSGNDIDVSSGATVNYRDSAAIKQVTLANTLKNAGLVNVAEDVISDIRVTNLVSNGGTINIDVDNPNLVADVIKVSGVANGTTQITFDEQSTLQLGENDRIYFAQTASGLSLSDYGFTSDVDNGEYTILIGNEVNATDNMLRDWFFYRYVEPTPPPAPEPIAPEDVAYVDLPRAAVEQTRSLLMNVGRTHLGGSHCECVYDECNNPYCHMAADGTKYRLWATPQYRWGSYKSPVETDYKIYGMEFGFDVQPNERQLLGVFGSYRDGTYKHDGKGKIISSEKGSKIDMKSTLAGLYYRHYFGNTYMLGAVYGGKLDADIKADNGVTASTDGTDVGAQLELGHDFRVTGRETLTPSIRATYDYIKFDDFKDSGNKEVKIEKAHDVELEAAVKYEYRFNNQYERLTTGYIKPSVIQTIEKGGEVTINGKKYDKTLKNETLGRIEVGADAELSDSISVGAFGNYTFGSDYNGWGVGGNLRVIW